MNKILGAIIISVCLIACKTNRSTEPAVKKKETWVFLMAGQSNMAGRGVVESQDTITNSRILTINKNNQLVKATEPIHFYEPNLKGVDCGLSFAQTMMKYIDESVTILLIPTAVGGSSISQWLGDSLHRNVRLLSNFKEKMAFARSKGTIKGILWHQGESDANAQTIPMYSNRLKTLFEIFRTQAEDNKLPIIMGELGAYSKTPEEWNAINHIIQEFANSNPNTALIKTSDLKHKGDFIHFDSEGQRTMGKRYAEAYLKLSQNKSK